MYEALPNSICLSYTHRNAGLDPQIFEALGFYLEIYGQPHLHAPFRSILTELLNNAFKANLKRSFFASKGFDFIKDYQRGQAEFVQSLQSTDHKLARLVLDHPRRVEFRLEPQQEYFLLRIANDSPIHPEEKKTITKILKETPRNPAQQIKNREGGGMGLRMIVSLLRNLGLDKESFQFHTFDDRTEFELTIPRAISIEPDLYESLSGLIQSYLPSLPVSLQDSDSEYDSIAVLLNAACLPKNQHARRPSELQLTEQRGVSSKSGSGKSSSEYPQYAKSYFQYPNGYPSSVQKWARLLAPDLDAEQVYDRVNVCALSRRLPHALTQRQLQEIKKRIGQPLIPDLRYEATGLRIAHPDFVMLWAYKQIPDSLWDWWFGVDNSGSLSIIVRIAELIWHNREAHPPREMAWKLYLDYLEKSQDLSKAEIDMLRKIIMKN